MLLSNDSKKGAGLVALLVLLFPLTDAQQESWFSSFRRGGLDRDDQRVRGRNPYSSLEEGLLTASSSRAKRPASEVLRKLTKTTKAGQTSSATVAPVEETLAQQGEPDADREYGASDGTSSSGGKKGGAGVRVAGSGGKKGGGKKGGAGVRVAGSGGKKGGGKKVGGKKSGSDVSESGTTGCPGSKGGKKGSTGVGEAGGSSGKKAGKKGATSPGVRTEGGSSGKKAGKKGATGLGVRTEGTGGKKGMKGGKKGLERKPAEDARPPKLQEGEGDDPYCEEGEPDSTPQPTTAPTPELVEPGGEPDPLSPAPTQRPTANPTSEPTASPTEIPTANPTSAPTSAPTASPTANPTSEPTTAPTEIPTVSPTIKKTLSPVESDGSGNRPAAPTASPTFGPTSQPTARPTLSPTEIPTVNPTSAPTSAPTVSPTANPTSAPTSAPTVSPTANPTSKPTPAPTESPTVSPTSEPTTAPTESPTVSPTASPTTTPTAMPTVPKKTLLPTVSDGSGNRPAAPTASPTFGPTSQPTVRPTLSPTEIPTANPTSAPTSAPTVSPTANPTSEPTTAPTESPTVSPTASPTTTPTAMPTVPKKTMLPTVSDGSGIRPPTSGPTSQPTVSPTSSPTTSPTAMPNDSPTSSPIARQTSTPTSSPTSAPSPETVEEVGPENPEECRSAYVVCHGFSVCFLDAVNFNGGQTGTAVGWSIDYGGTLASLEHGCECKIVILSTNPPDCNLDRATKIGSALISDNGVAFVMHDTNYLLESVQMYAGACVASDAGYHLDRIDSVSEASEACNATTVAEYAADTTRYPLKWKGDELVSGKLFYTGTPVNTVDWGNEYEIFPLGGLDRRYLSAHLTVCPGEGTDPIPTPGEGTAAPTVAPISTPTVGPTMSPTSEPTASPTKSPTMKPTSEPTASPTKSPTMKPTSEPTASPTTVPTTAPTSIQTVAPTQPTGEEGGPEECQPAVLHCPDQSVCFVDPEFNGGQTATGPGWSVDFSHAEAAIEHECICEILIQPSRSEDCNVGIEYVVGSATVTKNAIVFYLDAAGYMESIQIYSGPCEGSDGGDHLDQFDGVSDVCNATKVAEYAADTSKYPLQWIGDDTTVAQLIDASVPTTGWGSYEIFPLGGTDRQYMSAHLTVCLTDNLLPGPSTTSPTVSPTSEPTEKPTASPTSKPTAAPTEKPTASPTSEPSAAPTSKPTAGPTSIPTFPPSAIVEEGNPEDCKPAYVYCPGQSVCFLDSEFNGGQTASEPGFSVDFGSPIVTSDHDCECDILIQSDRLGDCSTDSVLKIGIAVVSKNGIAFVLHGSGYKVESIQMYAGPCAGFDNGGHLSRVDSVDDIGDACNATEVAMYAADTSKYPLQWIGEELESSMLFHAGFPENASAIFPLGGSERRYMSAHLTVCPDDGLIVVGEPSAAPSVAATEDPTVAPSNPPVPIPVDPVGGEEPPPSASPTTSPIAVPVPDSPAPTTSPTASPIAVPVPDSPAPTTSPTASPTNMPVVDSPVGSVPCIQDSDCDDGVSCTVDTCYLSTYCVFEPDDTKCDDGFECTADSCDAESGCINAPSDSECDDGIECTVDTCDTLVGCVNTPDDSQCDDGVPCTEDTCSVTSGCVNTPDNSQCDDGVPCTEDICDASNGCFGVPDDSKCDDGLACTVNTCSATSGCMYSPDDALCNDNEVCTFDRCDVTEGCVYSEFDLPFPTPGGSVKVTAEYPGTTFGAPSYFDLEVDSFFDAVRMFDSYCIDEDTSITPGTQYCGNMYSSHPNDWDDLPDTVTFEMGVESFSLINWIINQDYPNQDCGARNRKYTYGDIQRAIWEIIEGDGNVRSSGLGTWNQACTDEIQAAAVANGQGFIPDCDELVIMIIFPFECTDPELMKQTLLAIVPVSEVHPCCTV